MIILRRYLGVSIILSILMVMIILLGMDLFVQLLNEIDDIGQGNYHFLNAIVVALLNMPQSAYLFFPTAALVGSLLGLGTLAQHSELIVMRAAGVSSTQITKAVIRAAIVIMIVVTALGEGLAPRAMQLAQYKKSMAMSNGQALHTTQGVWLRDADNFIYVNSVTSGDKLSGIHWYQLNKAFQISKVGVAKSANFIDGQWHLNDVQETEIDGLKHTHSQQRAHEVWHIRLNPKVLALNKITSDEMSLPQLYDYIHYRKKNNLQANQYSLNFWQRVLQPIASVVMMVLAIPFIFGPLRSVTMGLRIVAGIGAGLVFYFVNQFFGPFSLVYQVPPLLAALIPILLFASIAGWFLWRTR